MGLLESGKAYVYWVWNGRPRPWSYVLLANMPWWLIWAALTPLVFALARRFRLGGNRWPAAVAVHLLAGVAMSAAHTALAAVVYFRTIGQFTGVRSAAEQVGGFLNSYLMVDVLTYAGIVGAWYAIEYYRRYRSSELAAAQLEARMHEARLAALRMELNPHFLFNALNAVSGLVRRGEGEAAVTMLARLGDLLRRTLNGDGRQETPLGEELDLLDQYLAIERVRFGERLDVSVEVEASLFDALVPTLVLQPIVENALRHGVARTPGPGAVRISAERRNGSLVLTVRDTGPGFTEMPERAAQGVGLANTRARLAQLYGGAGLLSVASAPDGGASVTITLPLHQEGTGHE